MTVSNGKLEDYIFALSLWMSPVIQEWKSVYPRGTIPTFCTAESRHWNFLEKSQSQVLFSITQTPWNQAIFPWSCIFSLEMAQLCQITFPNFWFMKIMVDAHFLKNFKLKIVSAVLKFTWHVTCLRCTAWGWASCVYCRTTRVSVNTSLITVSLFVVRIFQVHTQQLWGV